MDGKENIEQKSRKGWQGSPRKKTKRRIIKVVLGIFFFFLIFLFFIVPAILSSDKGLQVILSKINSSLEDGKAEISDLSVGWFKGVSITDFSYDDNAGWISVKVKSISTKPHYGSLITGNLNLGQTQIDTPQIEIDLNKKPLTPISTQKSSNKSDKAAQAATIALATDINLKDGRFKLTSADSKTVELAQINTDISIRPPGEQSNINLGMIVAANDKQSNIEINGQVKPKKKSGWTFKTTDCDIGVNIENLDLESIQPFLEMAGLEIQSKGSITVDVQSKLVDGQLENAIGTIKGSQLEIDNTKTNEKIKTTILDVDVKLSQKEQMLNIEKMNLQTDWAKIQASGAIPTAIKSLDSFLESDANYDLNGTFDCDVATIVSQIPVTIGLKDNAQITSGNLTGTITTSGSSGQKQIQAQARLVDLKGIVDGKQAELSEPISAEAKVSPNQGGLNINNLDILSSFVSLNAKGNLKQIKFDGRADLEKMQSEISQFVDIGPYKLTGEFIESGQVSLTEQNIALTGSSTIKNLNITGPNNVTASMSTGDMIYTMNLDKQKNELNIGSLIANMDFGQANINDAIIPLDKEKFDKFNAIVDFKQMNLGKLKPFAVLFGGMPENIGLAGIAESQISVISQNQVLVVKSDSTSLKNLKVTLPDNKPLERSEATAEFELNVNIEEEVIELKSFNLDSPDINVPHASLSQTKKDGVTKVNGEIELQYDWDALTQIVGPFMPEGLELKGKENNNINFVSEYPTDQQGQLLANLNAKADLGFERAAYMGLNIGKTDIDIAVANGVLDIPPFSTTVNEGKLNFGAKADFKKQPAFFVIDKPTQVIENIKLSDEMTRTLLKYLNPIFANASNVSGIANLHCEKLNIPLSSEHKNDTQIIATVSVTQLKLQASDILNELINALGGRNSGTVLTIHPTKFTLKDGYLRYDNMQIDIGNNPLNFSGVIGLDNSLNMTVILPYTFQGGTARVGGQNSGRITLPIKGTVDKPELDMSKLLEESIKQELPNLIERGLREIFN